MKQEKKWFHSWFLIQSQKEISEIKVQIEYHYFCIFRL